MRCASKMKQIFSSLEKITFFRFSNKQQLMWRCLIIIYLYLTCTVSDTFGECALHAVTIHCLDFTLWKMCWLLVIVGVLDWESVGVARKNEKPNRKIKHSKCIHVFVYFIFFSTRKKRERGESVGSPIRRKSVARKATQITTNAAKRKKGKPYKNRSYISRRRDAIEKSWQEEKVAAMNAKSRAIRKSIWYAVRFATYWVLDRLPWHCTSPSRHSLTARHTHTIHHHSHKK